MFQLTKILLFMIRKHSGLFDCFEKIQFLREILHVQKSVNFVYSEIVNSFHFSLRRLR